MDRFHGKNVNNLYEAMESSVRRIGIIQTNLENVHTVGFKSIHPDSVLFSETLRDVFRDESQGSFLPTEQKLDLALSIPTAFFLIEGKDGPERSRDGQFHINKDGTIVDSQNRELVILDQDPEKQIGAALVKGGECHVDRDGKIRVNGEFYGRVAIDYSSKQMPGERAFVLQGKLETSNVDLQENIVKLMQVKRHIDTVQGMLSMELGVDKALVETYGRNV